MHSDSPELRLFQREPGAGTLSAMMIRKASFTEPTARTTVGRYAGKKIDMPVIAKFGGIVLRLLIDRTFGIHVHAFHDNSEMVIELDSLRVIQSDTPPWVQDWVLWWVEHHREELLANCRIDLKLATPISRQAAEQLASRA